MLMLSWVEVLRKIRWNEGGIPVTGSNFALSVLMDHAGVIRRSEDEFSDTTCRGTSAMITAALIDLLAQMRGGG